MSMRFRKRPVVIEAMCFDGNEVERLAVYRWVRDGGGQVEIDPTDGAFLIATLEGRMRVDPGDWVIRGVAGEHYPCKPDIFAATYEPVT
jgi:hypothetical protein